MAILSGPEILRQMAEGKIIIDPFDPAMLDTINPNSVNLTLGAQILTYDEPTLDMRRENPYTVVDIPADGLWLVPGELYLGTTRERTVTHGFVPEIAGRSSVGRLGITVHVTAGFGEHGFDGEWTLEMTVVKPIKIYAGVEICQVVYSKLVGAEKPYAGKYQGQVGPQPSALWKEFLKKESACPR